MEFQNIYSDFDLKNMEKKLESICSQWNISFPEMVKEIYEGKGKGFLEIFFSKLKEAFLEELGNIKDVFIFLVVIILIASVFHTFKDMFRNRQIAEISFYVNYLILIILLTNLFGNVLDMGEKSLKEIEEFMRIFFPTYFLIVGSTAGVGTGVVYYQIGCVVIYLVEWCLVSFLLPALGSYMLFVLMNGIWEEERLSLLLEMYQKGIKLLLKLMLGVLTGAGMMQSMIVPLADRVKGETIYKAVELIPGIGEVSEGALRIWLGSAILIKNSIGIVGCIMLLMVSLIPILKIFVTAVLLKVTAALLSMVGDKKMITCTNQVGDGVFMILQTVCYGILFFIVLIALTIYTTSGGI